MGLDINIYKIHTNENGVSERTNAGYFRKVNFLIGVCERKMGREYDDTDNCTDMPFIDGIDDLMALRTACSTVLAKRNDDVASKMLPLCDGFFFGTREYGDLYYDDVQLFLKWLDKQLEESDDDDKFVLNAWW